MGLFDQGFGNRNGLSPAAIALLGLLAVKGFENRDKLAGMLNGALGGGNHPTPTPPTPGTQAGAATPTQASGQQDGLGGLFGGLAGALGGSASTGSVVSNGLGDLLNRFEQTGSGEVAQSWVKDGPNREPAPQQVEQAVGPDLVAQLAQQAGLSKEELLARLTHELPKAVDNLTPDSRVPTEGEVNASLSRQA